MSAPAVRSLIIAEILARLAAITSPAVGLVIPPSPIGTQIAAFQAAAKAAFAEGKLVIEVYVGHDDVDEDAATNIERVRMPVACVVHLPLPTDFDAHPEKLEQLATAAHAAIYALYATDDLGQWKATGGDGTALARDTVCLGGGGLVVLDNGDPGTESVFLVKYAHDRGDMGAPR